MNGSFSGTTQGQRWGQADDRIHLIASPPPPLTGRLGTNVVGQGAGPWPRSKAVVITLEC